MAALSPPTLSHPSLDGSNKRRKITRACDACKAKKKRCSGTQPCPSCERAAKPCTYLASYTRGRFKTPPPPLPLPPPPHRAGLDALVLAAESSAHDDSTTTTTTTATTVDDTALVSARPQLLKLHHQKARPRHSQKRTAAAVAAAAGGKIPRAFAEVRIPSPEELQQRAYLTPSSHDASAACFRADAFRQPDESWCSLPPDPELDVVDDPVSRGASLEPEAAVDGHYLGPDSGIAWLRRAWRRLGQVHHEMNVDEASSAEAGNGSSGSIFTHGDKETPGDRNADFTFPSPERADYLVSRYFEYAAPTYRFLHRPTLASWLAAMQDPSTAPGVSPARQAIVLLVFATATIYDLNKHDPVKPDASIRAESESYQHAAREHLSREAGAPTLESAQARFALCHFLLSTARPNEAWFTFGTTAQLALALGLHQRQRGREAPSSGADTVEAGDALVARECRRRLFWSMYTLDTYLSVMFGRPRLLRDEDITQPLPHALNDEDIVPAAGSAAAAPAPPAPATDADCVMHAAIFHARLARILSRAIALQQQQRQRRHRRRDSGNGSGSAASGEGDARAGEQKEEQRALSAAAGLHAELDAWKARLPPFLSGAIRPSSLIPVFRRQATVLQIAYAHAVMFVGRGFLLGGEGSGVGDGAGAGACGCGGPGVCNSQHHHNAQTSPSSHTHSHYHASPSHSHSQHQAQSSPTSSTSSHSSATRMNPYHSHGPTPPSFPSQKDTHTGTPATAASPSPTTLATATLKAALEALQLVRTFVAEKQPFPAFWFAQHIAFNAVAVAWVWVLEGRERRGRGKRDEGCGRGDGDERGEGRDRNGGGGGEEGVLLNLAETVYGCLAAVGENSAPCLRYGIVLRELRGEVRGGGEEVGVGEVVPNGEAKGRDGALALPQPQSQPQSQPQPQARARAQGPGQPHEQADACPNNTNTNTNTGGQFPESISTAFHTTNTTATAGIETGETGETDVPFDVPFDLGVGLGSNMGVGLNLNPNSSWAWGWGLGMEFWPRLDALPLGETF